MSKILIRKATGDDLDFIAGCLKLMLEDISGYGGDMLSKEISAWNSHKEKLKKYLEKPDKIFLIAVDETKKINIGYAESRVENVYELFAGFKFLHISGIYISPEYRKKGIGRHIIKYLQQYSKKNNCRFIELNVLLNNPAYELYKEMGFNDFLIKMRKYLS